MKRTLSRAGLALAAELELGKPWGRAAGTTGILSYEPGVVATHVQDLARAADPAVFPSHEVFHNFAADGSLQPATAVVGDVVDFLAADEVASFVEKRFGQPRPTK